MASEAHDVVQKDMTREISHAETSSAPLTQRLSQVSKSAHSISNALVAARLAVVCTDKLLYAKALAAFWHVHAALEVSVAKHAHHEALKEIARLTRSLGRAAAFEADLLYLLGPEWKSQVAQCSPAVTEYVKHLNRISSSDPTRLVAHAYTQHLALLAGGQRIQKFVASTVPGLQGKDGVSVFSFEEPADTLKKEYKHAVDALKDVLGDEGTQKVLEEHVRVFEYNKAIISDFPVRTRDAFRAVQRVLPPELILTACATVFALLMMWATPKIMVAVKVWEGATDAASSFSMDADAIDPMHTRSSEL